MPVSTVAALHVLAHNNDEEQVWPSDLTKSTTGTYLQRWAVMESLKMQQLELEDVRVDAIEVDAADLPPFRWNRGDLTGLKESIEKFGLLVPPVVWHTKDSGRDRWVVVDGSRRVAALQDLKFEAEAEDLAFSLVVIKAAVFRGTLAQAQTLSAVLHLGAARNNRGDEAVASYWLESHGMKQAVIARLADRDQTWVSHSKTFATELAPTVLQRFRTDATITGKHAHELAKLVNSDGTPDLSRQMAAVNAILPPEDRPKKPRGRVPRRVL